MQETTGEPAKFRFAVAGLQQLDLHSLPDMLTLARMSVEAWQHSRERSAAESLAARRLALAVARLDDMGAFDHIDAQRQAAPRPGSED